MRALLTTAPGGPETLTVGQLPDPVAGPGQLLVRNHACALNFPDVLMIEDKYQYKPPRPYAPGCEIAGVVEAVGEGVTGFAVGDRVCGMTGHGGMAEKVAADARLLYQLPEKRSFAEGSALVMTYSTAIHALLDRGQIAAGQTVLVLGAAGGVGLACVELAKAFGARVVAAVSSPEKADFARAAGADETVIYPHAPLDKAASRALAEAFKAACGPDGAHIVCDNIGGDYSEPALRAIAWEGRFLIIGFTAGIAAIPLNLPLLKACEIVGVFLGAWRDRNPDQDRAHVAHLFELWEEGKISPRISEQYPLERGGEAIAKLAARTAMGKLVITI